MTRTWGRVRRNRQVIVTESALLLLTPSAGYGGGIERVADAIEHAWRGRVRRVDLYRQERVASPEGHPLAKAGFACRALRGVGARPPGSGARQPRGAAPSGIRGGATGGRDGALVRSRPRGLGPDVRASAIPRPSFAPPRGVVVHGRTPGEPGSDAGRRRTGAHAPGEPDLRGNRSGCSPPASPPVASPCSPFRESRLRTGTRVTFRWLPRCRGSCISSRMPAGWW